MAIILRPRHISGLWGPMPMGSRTALTYQMRQKMYLATNPAAVEPYEVTRRVEAYIGGGVWRVLCRCGEAPHADPDWKLSCCFGCGAIHTNITFPDNLEAIEALLAKRPVQLHRNWRTPETLEDLMAEQRAHGDPV